jgi:hypothetical protein
MFLSQYSVSIGISYVTQHQDFEIFLSSNIFLCQQYPQQ